MPDRQIEGLVADLHATETADIAQVAGLRRLLSLYGQFLDLLLDPCGLGGRKLNRPADALDLVLVQAVVAERSLAGVDGSGLEGHLGRIVMPAFLEGTGVHDVLAPFLLVGVGDGLLLGATQLLLGLVFLVLDPLVHLDFALQLEGIHREIELRIFQNLVSNRRARDMHQLALQRRVHLVVFGLDDIFAALVQCPLTLHRATFVPP